MTFTEEQVAAVLRSGWRHGDYDSDYRDGWNDGVRWIESNLKKLKAEMESNDESI